jgi:hypothetical protein
MRYELAKQLKDAGFPQTLYPGDGFIPNGEVDVVYCDTDDFVPEHSYMRYPTLPRLIEACGDTVFFDLVKLKDGWVATDHYLRGEGLTPFEAVVNLWLASNQKNNV